MQNIGMNNFLSVVTGILVILICCLVAYYFHKHFFSKYKNKVENTINKDKKTSS